MSRSIILRADGSSQFGMGHIFRCIALAQGLQDKGHVPVFVVKDHAQAVLDVIRKHGFEVIAVEHTKGFTQDAQSVIETVRLHKAATVIVDLNHSATLSDEAGFENYLLSIKNSGSSIVMVDGLGLECISSRRALNADVLLIPYVGAQEGTYKTIKGTALLLGTDYFPFQKDFLRVAAWPKTIAPQARRLLVSMGGGNVTHMNDKVVEAILSLDLPDLELKVTGVPLSENMPELIHWADLAVTGSGLTKYEMALLGTPAIVLSLNEVHKNIMDTFAQAGSVQHLGTIEDVPVKTIADAVKQLAEDQPLRKQMSLKGKNLVDGRGAGRVIDQIPLEVTL